MAIQLQPRRTVSAGAVELFRVDLQDHLDSGETLTGTPTFTNISGVITFGTPSRNSAEITVDGRPVAANKACYATGTVSSSASGDQEISIQVQTSAGRTLPFELPINVT